MSLPKVSKSNWSIPRTATNELQKNMALTFGRGDAMAKPGRPKLKSHSEHVAEGIHSGNVALKANAVVEVNAINGSGKVFFRSRLTTQFKEQKDAILHTPRCSRFGLRGIFCVCSGLTTVPRNLTRTQKAATQSQVFFCMKTYEPIAQNVIEGDTTDFNASPVVSENRLYLRSDQAIYCIGA